ncbi:hypothetical protein MEI_01241 [Bartonella vinsonii subsp. arupensis Pm136co]|uniref:Uncharacterized protein n=1 Tax=Bartonella vinsonii subsp. arupensis Pm136co TaxID=1094561 RepID=A0ABP2QVY2_BARVI|nr:hypothetical protein MEI_01241 [Bartonella vinsonii subsp. arupensis Pm136co]
MGFSFAWKVCSVVAFFYDEDGKVLSHTHFA